MTNNSGIQAFVFDFGGVFTVSRVAIERLRGYDTLLQLPPDSLQTALFSGEAWELRSTGRITADDYWARSGGLYEERLPPDFRGFRDGMFWAEPINEEMLTLARRLHRRYPLAICSNALPELVEILHRRPELGQLFDVQVISVLVGMRKPDAGIYRLTAERLGLPLGACLLIDDKARNVEAARAVGMPGIVFESAQGLEAELATRGLLPRE